MEFLVILLAILITYFCFTKKTKKTELNLEKMDENIKIVHTSDIHYLAEKEEEKFGFGINLDSIKGIFKEFSLKIQEEKPDCLIITGDLTHKGDRNSHIELAKELNAIEEKGIPVLVIPGNKDIYNVNSKFEGAISENEFKAIYSRFGYDDIINVIGRDKTSMSYMYALNNHVNILMIDVETSKEYMSVSKSSFRWMEKMLRLSKEENKIVISASHENILAHNKNFVSKYKIKNSSKLVNLFNKYNIRVNLSGHMHIQHISENKGVRDAAVECLGIYPNKYAELIVNIRDRMKYTTKELKEYKEESKSVLIEDSKLFAIKQLKELDIPEDEKVEMIDCFINTNLAYFSGELASVQDTRGYKLWEGYLPHSEIFSYLKSVDMESAKDHNKFNVD